MGLDSHYGDKDAKKNGKWFPIKSEETELLIRHASNEDYMQYLVDNLSQQAREFLTALTDDGSSVIQTDDVPELDDDVVEETNDILREAAANELLVDWKNLSLDDEDLAAKFDKEPGENIGYTTERAIKLFELLPEFYNEVKEIAQNRAAFTKEQESRDTKN